MSGAAPVVLLDTNVLLDLVLAREPWATEAGALLTAVYHGRAQGVVAAHTVTTLFYLVARGGGRQRAREVVQQLLDTVQVVPVAERELRQALGSDLADYADAVQAMVAVACGARCIATRNLKDFAGSPVPAMPPGQVLALLTTG